ncbi:hypothetical protein MTO96_049282 [Rhipicephalus appendiculatus]
MKYYIVEFVDEKTCELVPATWVVGKFCFWPPGPGSQTAIRNYYEPRKSWKKYPAVIKGTFNNYEDGRRKLPLAEYSSDLDMEQGLKKRKIQKPARYVEQELCEAPKPPSDFPEGQEDDIQAGGGMSEDSSDNEDSSFEMTTQEAACGLANAKEQVYRSPASGPRSHSRKILPEEEFQREVLTRLSVLRIVQQQHGELLTALTTRHTMKDTDKGPAVIVGRFDNHDELQKFDQTLTGSVREALIQQLATIGGPNPESSARRVLRTVLSDKLAAKFSWNGRKGKDAFESLNLSKCVVERVQATQFGLKIESGTVAP